MKLFKKNKKNISFKTILIVLLNFFLISIFWLFAFNPIMHYLIDTDEAYMEDVIGMYETDAIKGSKIQGV